MLRRVWERHFARDGTPPSGAGGIVRFRPKEELPAAEKIETPYDPEARFRHRGEVSWIGYIVHLSETCEDDVVHLLTHVMTTTATVHEARCTAAIHAALVAKGLPPGEHLVDSAYVDAELLVRSREELDIALVGPGRPDPTWQTRVEGAFTAERFAIDWERRRAWCPQGKLSTGWSERVEGTGRPYVRVSFRQADCGACPARILCTRNPRQARQPEAAAAGGVRGAPDGTQPAHDRDGAPPLRPTGRDRGHHLARRARLRAAPGALSWPGQDPPAARRDRRGDQPRPSERLVLGGPTHSHPHLMLRRSRRLTRIRQQYRTSFLVAHRRSSDPPGMKRGRVARRRRHRGRPPSWCARARFLVGPGAP